MKTFQLQKVALVKEAACEYHVNDTSSAKEVCAKIGLENECDECVMLFCLNVKGDVVASFEVSRGTPSMAYIHPREVFKKAILANSEAIIVAHNHPSGNVEPSLDDFDAMNRLSDAGKIMGIPVADFVITAPHGGFYSAKLDEKL